MPWILRAVLNPRGVGLQCLDSLLQNRHIFNYVVERRFEIIFWLNFDCIGFSFLEMYLLQMLIQILHAEIIKFLSVHLCIPCWFPGVCSFCWNVYIFHLNVHKLLVQSTRITWLYNEMSVSSERVPFVKNLMMCTRQQNFSKRSTSLILLCCHWNVGNLSAALSATFLVFRIFFLRKCYVLWIRKRFSELFNGYAYS